MNEDTSLLADPEDSQQPAAEGDVQAVPPSLEAEPAAEGHNLLMAEEADKPVESPSAKAESVSLKPRRTRPRRESTSVQSEAELGTMAAMSSAAQPEAAPEQSELSQATAAEPLSKKALKAARKAAKQAEKEAKKAAKQAEKEAEKAEKAERKAAKQAEKEAKKAKKAAKNAAKETA